MADVPKSKGKAKKLAHDELVKQDSMAFAHLLYDIWKDKKRKEKDNDLPSNK